MNFGKEPMVSHEEQGKKAVYALAQDIAFLAQGIEGKTPESIDFEAVLAYLELLKGETTRMQHGVYAKDNSIHYTSGGEISFDKSSSRTR